MDKKLGCRINMRQPNTGQKIKKYSGISRSFYFAFSGDAGNLHGTELSNIIR